MKAEQTDEGREGKPASSLERSEILEPGGEASSE
jgi:hypothetical protein